MNTNSKLKTGLLFLLVAAIAFVITYSFQNSQMRQNLQGRFGGTFSAEFDTVDAYLMGHEANYISTSDVVNFYEKGYEVLYDVSEDKGLAVLTSNATGQKVIMPVDSFYTSSIEFEETIHDTVRDFFTFLNTNKIDKISLDAKPLGDFLDNSSELANELYDEQFKMIEQEPLEDSEEFIRNYLELFLINFPSTHEIVEGVQVQASVPYDKLCIYHADLGDGAIALSEGQFKNDVCIFNSILVPAFAGNALSGSAYYVNENSLDRLTLKLDGNLDGVLDEKAVSQLDGRARKTLLGFLGESKFNELVSIFNQLLLEKGFVSVADFY